MRGGPIALGYDPGGNGGHRVAAIRETGRRLTVEVATCATVEAAVAWLGGRQRRGKTWLGIDTLTAWSTGHSGWRPADRALRAEYGEVGRSVASSNSLHGAMSVNGMMLLAQLRASDPSLAITETHPKVLYFQESGTKYDYRQRKGEMDEALASWIGCPIPGLANDHEWDALISALVAWRALRGEWTFDLHTLPAGPDESLVWPVGKTAYYWPKELLAGRDDPGGPRANGSGPGRRS